MRAVIDTNVWVSAILSPKGYSARVVDSLGRREFVPVFTNATLLELKDAVTAPVLVSRFGWHLASLNDLILLLTSAGLELSEPEPVRLSRDPADDVFIALAVAAAAEYLVTRDDDLKGDAAVRAHLEAAGVRLATVREFAEVLAAR